MVMLMNIQNACQKIVKPSLKNKKSEPKLVRFQYIKI